MGSHTARRFTQGGSGRRWPPAGLADGGEERCANPASIHYCEVGTITSLRHKDGRLPTQKGSFCDAARLIKKHGGFTKPPWGNPGDDLSQYKRFVELCRKRK